MASPRRFHLNQPNAQLLGVCAGLAAYKGVNVWLIRFVLVALSVLLSLLTVPVYILIAWLAPGADWPNFGSRLLTFSGPLLLVGGLVGAIIVLQADTSRWTPFGRMASEAALGRQQNMIIVCGIIAIVGAILTVMRWRT